MNSALYNGIVSHQRLRPVRHMLKYRMFYVLLDLDELEILAKRNWFFSINKFNILSFRLKDFGSSAQQNLKADILQMVKTKLKIEGVTNIRLLCIPRLFGYAFNPISAYFCYDRSEQLLAIIYEVRNTFGEKIHYVLAGEINSKSQLIEHSCQKEMFVSPFMEMNCHYHFKIVPPKETVVLAIHQTQADRPILNASFSGSRVSLTDFVIIKQIALFPVNSLKVIVGIYFEALKLWCKGMTLKARVTKAQVESQKTIEEKN